MSGVFITLEGGEGVGKSTHLAAIADQLRAAGKNVDVTREPGGTPFAEAIRELLLAPREDHVGIDAELLLMFAARAAHLEERIRPGINEGRWVLCDRFTDASYAYQGGGRGVPMERIRQLEDWVQKGFRPHATILLDAPVEVGLARARERGEPDRFEREAVEFFERVRQTYLDRAAAEPERFIVVEASQSLQGVAAAVHSAVEKILERFQ